MPPDLRDLNYSKFVEEARRASRRPRTTNRTTRVGGPAGNEGIAAEAGLHPRFLDAAYSRSCGVIVRVVITGAGGFIGRNLIAALAPRADVEVIPVTRAMPQRNCTVRLHG